MELLKTKDNSAESALSFVSCRSPSSMPIIRSPTRPRPAVRRQHCLPADWTMHATPDFELVNYGAFAGVSRIEDAPTTPFSEQKSIDEKEECDDDLLRRSRAYKPRRIATCVDSGSCRISTPAHRSPYPLMNSTCIGHSGSDNSRKRFDCSNDLSIISETYKLGDKRTRAEPLEYDHERDSVEREGVRAWAMSRRRRRLKACADTLEKDLLEMVKNGSECSQEIPHVVITKNTKVYNFENVLDVLLVFMYIYLHI